MNRLFAGLIVVAAAQAAAVGVATAAPIDESVTVAIEPVVATVTLGDSLELAVTVANEGEHDTASLVAHIDITDPRQDSSVDPEDWTSTLSKAVGVLQPGESTEVVWDIQPISGGTFTVYAVALADGEAGLAVSNAMTVSVDDRRSLDPGGILPIALGMPAGIGALLLFRVRATRRAGRH